jgi:hypothetical protein
MLRAPNNGRQVLGKVMVDPRNGNIWGFPTLTQEPFHRRNGKYQSTYITPVPAGEIRFRCYK